MESVTVSHYQELLACKKSDSHIFIIIFYNKKPHSFSECGFSFTAGYYLIIDTRLYPDSGQNCDFLQVEN